MIRLASVLFGLVLFAGNVFSSPAHLVENFGSIPLAFTLNEGQSASPVRFTAQGSGCTMAFSPSGTTFLLSRETAASVAKRAAKKSVVFETDPTRDTPEYESFALGLSFVGANQNPEVRGEERLPWNNNYFIGNDPDQWRTDVPNYKKIRLREVYKGIDLVYYGNRKRVKYDFVVKPGEDPERILLQYDFGKSEGSLAVNEKGELVVTTPVGNLIEEKPYCYQKINGKEVEVEIRYEAVEGGTYRFRVGAYDKGYDLVIDPELVFSTYLGGLGEDSVNKVAIDEKGDVYVIGKTQSMDFPITPGALSNAYNQKYVAKINSSGTALIYATYLGGNDGYGTIDGLAVDRMGNAYVAGSGVGSKFPVTKGVYSGTVNNYVDCFATKINAQGNGLVYSTFLGGSNHEFIQGMALDENENLHVTGYTDSFDFPATPGAYRENTDKNYYEGFLTKLNQDGSALVYSTFLGKTGYEKASVTVDNSGCAIVAGETQYLDFPVTPGSYQRFHGGGWDIFVTKISKDGSNSIYSALFGGVKDDYVTGIVVDDFGNAFISGYTESGDYPVTPGTFQESFKGEDAYDQWNGFVTKINPSGSDLVYSTFFSGWKGPAVSGFYERTKIFGIAVNGKGEAYITGSTEGLAFPTTSDAYQKTLSQWDDAFLSRFCSDGSSLIFSTLLGGEGTDIGKALAINLNGDVVIAGYTGSYTFPVTSSALGDSLSVEESNGPRLPPQDAFIAKFHFSDEPDAVEEFHKPIEFGITGVFPNPFNPSTTIGCILPEPGKVAFSVYSVTGQKVREMQLTFSERGRKQIQFDGRDSVGHMLASGVYMVRLEFGKLSDSRKVMLVK